MDLKATGCKFYRKATGALKNDYFSMREVNLRNKLDEETTYSDSDSIYSDSDSIYSDSVEPFKVGLSKFEYRIKQEWSITQTLVYLKFKS